MKKDNGFMKKDNVGAFDQTKRGISRRRLLQGLGCGLAGGVFAQTLGTRPANAAPIQLDAETSPVFDIQVDPSGLTTVIGEATYLNGMMFLRTNTQSNLGAFQDLQCFDVQSNQFVFSLRNLLPSFNLPETPFVSPVTDGLNIYTANQSIIFNIDVNGNALEQWTVNGQAGEVASNLVLMNANQDLLFYAATGVLASYNISAQAANWATSLGPSVPGGSNASVVVAGNIVYAVAPQNATSGLLIAVDATTGVQIYNNEIPSNGGAAFSASQVFVSGSDNVLRAFDASSGKLSWTYPANASHLNGPLVGPACNNGQVLLADGAGILHAVDQTTGLLSWQANLTGAPAANSSIFVEDQIAYFSLGGAGSLTLFGYDLSAQSGITYATQSTGTFVGVENGVCYFSHNSGKNVAGRSFTSDLHGLSSESALMEDYVTSSSSNTPVRQPSYRTHLLFLDSNYNPRAYKSVKVWASDTATIASNDTIYQIGPNSAVWLKTDGAGELAIVVTPDNVSCPALYVWNTYMLIGDAMVLYPDWDNTNSLATLQSANMPATNPFDGTSLFAGVTGTEAIANSIRNTIGGGSQPSLLLSRRGEQIRQNLQAAGTPGHRRPPRLTEGTSYVAYPASTPNMTFVPSYAGVDLSRPYAPASGGPQTWSLNFENGAWSYGSGVSSSGVSSALHISWHDLVKNVVHGVENVVKVVAQVGADITHEITTIANDVQQVYTLIIDSVEAAVAVVASVLKSVLNSIDAAIKWLSYLFDWSSFVTTQQAIVSMVLSRSQNFVNWAAAASTTGLADVHQFFKQIEDDVTQAIAAANNNIGGYTIQSQQVDNNDPQYAYGAHGAKSYSQSRWMTEKLKANVGQTTSASTGVGDPASDIVSVITGLITSIGQTLADSAYTHIPADLKALFESFSNLTTNPSAFVAQSISGLLNIFRDLVVGFIQFIDAIIESVLAAIPQLINGAIKLVTAPISIPVIDTIFTAAGAGQLTMLNLAALVIAIPATIVSKVTGGSAQAGVGADDTAILWSLGFAGFIYAILDTISDTDDLSASSGEAVVNLALSILTLFLAIPFDSQPSDVLGYMFYLMSAAPVALSACSIGIDLGGTALLKGTWSAGLPEVNCLYGASMLGVSLAVGLANPGTFGNLTMIQNLFTYIPYLGKIFATGPAASLETPERFIPGAIDFVGDMGAAMLSVRALV